MVLNVFSPSDMNIINAILNCGVGGEIEIARNTLDMVQELNPDGGYVYTVSLYPSNWFDLLDSSFTGVDLLESPAALSQRMRLLQMQRNNILLNLTRLTSTIPEDKSTHINSSSGADNEMSIISFISHFKEMLEEYNKTVLGAKEIANGKEA